MTSTTINRNDTNTENFGLRSVPESLFRMARGLVAYMNRRRAERQLEALDDRLLADIGIMRGDIQRIVWCGGRR
jgi:uncharacterized protein YjiS (DUF1127 family)